MEIKYKCPKCHVNLVKEIETRGGKTNGDELLKDRCTECGKVLY